MHIHDIKYIFISPWYAQRHASSSHFCIITLYFNLCCTFLEDLAPFIRISEYFRVFSPLFFFLIIDAYHSAVWAMTLWNGYFLKRTSPYIWALKVRRFGDRKTSKLDKGFFFGHRKDDIHVIWNNIKYHKQVLIIYHFVLLP